ncbi:MAG: aldehyde dehydrogenase family protein [Fibromonadales bacterium]|nr:aldehyde dehydrogenase family protein [Fibromonadales bacterium]
MKSFAMETRAFIGGNFVTAASGETIKKECPADGSAIEGVPSCGEAEVELAVKSARAAYKAGVWRNKSLKERKEVLLKLASLMEEQREQLASLDTYETGRAYRNYYEDSIPKAIEVVKYFAESIDKIYDNCVLPSSSEFAAIIREPLGVVACITPWNDPLVPANWKIIPALLMGNSVIVKPAEQSSLSIILEATLAKNAGIPDGVLNIVTGYGDIAGKALALHNDVDGVFFTGSSEVGKLILQYSGMSNMKKVGLECGGKSAFIVSASCKRLKEAAGVLAASMFYNQGQICSAPSRAIIDNKIKAEFMEYLKIEAQKYVPQDPFSPESIVGGVVSKEQQLKIEQYISLGKESGYAVFQFSGKNTPRNGVFPTIFENVEPGSRLFKEEIFGPVLIVLGFDSLDEAINIANDSIFGLAGAIWTDDLREVNYAARNIEAGIIHVNSYGNDDNSVPFGGYKQSGIGKDKSVYAFDEYSQIKTVWVSV